MAGLADRSKLPLVHLGLRMAGTAAEAILWTWLEGNAGVAVGAANRNVLTGELVVTLRIVIKDVLTSFQVAALTLFAKASSVRIIFFVAAGSRAVGWCLGELLIWMTLGALGHTLMQTKKRPLGVVGVVKSHRLPTPRLVAAIALVL